MEPAKSDGAAGVDANQTGPERLRVSLRTLSDGARAAESVLMREGLVERRRSKLQGVASIMIGRGWSEAVGALADARRALEGSVREAASEGLLDDCREGMKEELAKGAPEIDCVMRELTHAALQRSISAERAGETARAEKERGALARWADDEEFWGRLGEACAEPSAYDKAAALWGGSFGGRWETDWAQTLTKAMELAMISEGARDGVLRLVNRLERAVRLGEGSFAWGALGQTGGLPATNGVDPEQARETVAATPMDYWLSVRRSILGGAEPDEGQRMLSDAILEAAIAKAPGNDAVRVALGEHLWLNLDLDGLGRWEAKSPSGPLAVIGDLSPRLGDGGAHIGLANALRQPRASEVITAFEMAELSLGSGGWGGEGFAARAKTAFEGAYALLQARELKAQTLASRAPAAKKAGASL